MRILITGANGFIGSNLAKHLAGLGRYEVYALVRYRSVLDSLRSIRNRIKIVKVKPSFESIYAAVRKAKPDVVVHLAAFSSIKDNFRQVKPIIDSNILFSTLLVEAMIKNNIFCMVNTGSFWEQMKGARDNTAVNLYAASKTCFEDILRYYADAKNLRFITLRLFGVYGPNDPRGKIFSIFRKSMTQKKPVLLSPGEQVMDMVYINDVVNAYEKAIRYVYKKNNNKPELFFIGSGTGLKLRKIGRIFEQCAGRRINVKWGGRSYRPKEIMYSKADIRPAKKRLKWEPEFNLKDGISDMLRKEDKL